MIKLYLNTRDELMVIDLAEVIYFQANGNYTEFAYLSGDKHMVTFGLTRMEDFIKQAWKLPTPSPFARLGRSLIVNTLYLREISLLRQTITLGDCKGGVHRHKVSKALLKKFKDLIVGSTS